MTPTSPQTIHLKDYQKPSYSVRELYLDFQINESLTTVKNKAFYTATTEEPQPLLLHGLELDLQEIAINGELLASSGYKVEEETLTILNPPAGEFTLETTVEIKPQDNKSCEGLYQSGDIFCTQNEPEGFRRITYFLDRSDVMTKYTTRIEADKTNWPILLSNGNKIDSGELDGGRHFVVWNDPFAKPSYLFALVAGDFGLVTDSFTTMTGREIDLEIYVDKGNENRAQYSLDSLKKSMKWDEDVYGLEYDLDIYMIVAVDQFNMGAMENKGLNIFNTSCALANPATATDGDFFFVEAVIGHEYFHNWTGNRVTCRDWFQLTLKEGLTVFRDQTFSEDLNDPAVCRIREIRGLRNGQFVEDGGPTAHPIKPASYIEINNFYTHTVYKKGSEVIRMIRTLIGKENFRKGMDKYFELFDGQAVTTEDFVHAMELASGFDLTQFRNSWYAQAGTPTLDISSDYDAVKKTFSLSVEQSCRPTTECAEKKAYHMPLVVGLLNAQGEDMDFTVQGQDHAKYLNLTDAKQTFVLEGVSEKPVPSLLRNFSAPVKKNYAYTAEELCFLLANDSDAFNRYEAGQLLAKRELEKLIEQHQNDQDLAVDEATLDAFYAVIKDQGLSNGMKAEILVLPTETELVEAMEVCDFDAADAARKFLTKALAKKAELELKAIYDELNQADEYIVNATEMAKRSLKNSALSYLVSLDKEEYFALAFAQQDKGANMTDEYAAFVALCHSDSNFHQQSIDLFRQRWANDNLVRNKWFSAQASSRVGDSLNRVEQLLEVPEFDFTNPNNIRAVIGAFGANTTRFHEICGEGYHFMADQILAVDAFNSNIASGLALSFRKYAKLDAKRQALMKVQLERIVAQEGLSKDVYEIISKTLDNK